jgi:hybrid polyketide synthase / nonribosomal peptide synthetase ACE1
MESIWPETLSQRIDEMAEAYPHSIAIKDTHGNCLSYKTMIERVKDIQAAMVKIGIGEGSNVAVFLQPSTDWICSLLAVMRQGAIYVPLDSSQGLTRLHQIFALSSPTTILVDSSTTQEAAAWARLTNVINVNDLQATPDSNPLNSATPNRLAVILFTSGTTGTPKGILLQHSALVNVIEGMVRRYNLGRQTVLQQSAFSFDMSLEQTFLALCNGGTLVVADRSIRGDSRALMKVIATEGITYTKATPPEYLSWFRHGASYVTGNKTWKYIFAGGDRMTETMKSELRSLGLPHIRLFNSYGPAESTIIATKMEQSYGIDDETDGSIPIGFPLPNYSIYIVDDKLSPLPQGVPGEILIGGQGVAIGYLSDASQNEKRFLDNPWAGPEYVKRGWTKMYRSGDKGHLTKQGALVFHGRIAGDTQVKLQGIRLELEDIENNILKEGKGSLSEAVCTIHGESDFNYLVAHVVFSPGFPSSVDVGREFLSRLLQQLPLPQYMKPAALFPLESLPLTMHGKIDRAAIAAIPVVQNVGREEEDFKLSELESRLGSIWRQLLPKEAIPASLNRSSDFFMLGGSSVLLLEVQFLIRTNFNIDISLQELFEVTTLVKMAAKIQVLVNAKAVNWDIETTPPRTDEFVDAEPQPIRLTGLEVVVTGTTGHLGGFILDGLVSDPAIAKIHCVAVRDPSKLRSTSDKVIVHRGDLAKAQLGLPTSDLTHLASTTDAIIHCGATRLNWETFESMVAVNVTSTRELIRLAAPRRVPIHFVSSGGVFPADVAPSERSAASHVPPRVGVDGYVASKWASEQMLERSARDIGLPVHIYRTVRADEGTFPEELPEEILAGMAKATIQSMVMTEHGGDAWVGWFDLVSAIDVAGSICTAVSTRMALSEELGVRFVNHKATYRVWKDEHLNKLVARPEIQERIGRFKMMPPQIWLGELKKSGFPWMIGASDAVYKDRVRNRR